MIQSNSTQINILSFDIEEWYIYDKLRKGSKDYYLPILKNYLFEILKNLDQRNIKATFFCLGIIARQNPWVIKAIQSHGHEIGCHSDLHHLIHSQSFKDFEEDTRIALDSLQQVLGQKVIVYRAPAFSISLKNSWTFEVLMDAGIEYDSSIILNRTNLNMLSSIKTENPFTISIGNNKLRQFPLRTRILFGKQFLITGGGHFRILPNRVIYKNMQSSDYNMAYFHIRDFDVKQKRIIGPRYFQSYYGINSSFSKFKTLLDSFQFNSLSEASAGINWEEYPTIYF